MAMIDRAIEERDVLRYCAIATAVRVEDLVHGIREAYIAVDRHLGERGLEDRGPAIVRYRRVSRGDPLSLEVGWVMPDVETAAPPFIAGQLPAGSYVVGWHNGPYARVGAVARELIEWGDEQGLAWDVEREGESERWASWYELYLAEPSFGPEGPTGSVEVCLLLKEPPGATFEGVDLRDR